MTTTNTFVSYGIIIGCRVLIMWHNVIVPITLYSLMNEVGTEVQRLP